MMKVHDGDIQLGELSGGDGGECSALSLLKFADGPERAQPAPPRVVVSISHPVSPKGHRGIKHFFEKYLKVGRRPKDGAPGLYSAGNGGYGGTTAYGTPAYEHFGGAGPSGKHRK
ncbi:hypothetical protein BV20DRAFT_960746 [Pilatotrama ljubarskyi]|nr:hypothetical protein BV20DRAFT_960746 [Pilatotrama ljubarskyi]